MDDYNVNVLSETKNEYSARLLELLSPAIIEGIKSIFNDAMKICQENNEEDKYLMTFQNYLTRVPKWNSTLIEAECQRIIHSSKCSYLEDLLTCVHITHLKLLTSVRVSQKQKKIDIDIPKLSTFIHKIYIHLARKIYSNVYLFEKDKRKPIWKSDTGGDIYSVALSEDGEYIAVGCNELRLYHKDSSTPLWIYDKGLDMYSVTISADGQYIVAGSYDKKIYLFSKESNTTLWQYQTDYFLDSVDISADGKYIVAGSEDDYIYLFNKNSNSTLWTYDTEADVRSVAISADGEYIVAGSANHRVYLFNRNSNTPIINYETDEKVWLVDISANGEYFIAGSHDKNAYLFVLLT